MDNEEKYKLALFAVIRNSSVMPAGVKMGKSMREINRISIETLHRIMDMCDFDILKRDFESAEF